MQNVSIQRASELSQAVKSAVEQLLGRSIAPDEEISVAAVPPQRVPPSECRAAVAQNLEAFLNRRADKVNGLPEDFVIDDETWTIRYLIVDTRNWWPGKKVLISTQWIERISWEESKVFVNLTREAIKQGPEYTDQTLITRDHEMKLHRHYNREGYWAGELAGSAR